VRSENLDIDSPEFKQLLVDLFELKEPIPGPGKTAAIQREMFWAIKGFFDKLHARGWKRTGGYVVRSTEKYPLCESANHFPYLSVSSMYN
jgi:hypothetical protein